MARRVLAVLVVTVAVLAMAVPSWARGYENKKSAGKFDVTLKVDRYPLVKGNNAVKVQVTDRTGKPAANAKVSVRYYMPAMPGMAPMSYSVTPSPKGDEHEFAADVPMEGGWKFEVTVNEDDSATFNLDAR
jgi:nitrogen fixation protein FixH